MRGIKLWFRKEVSLLKLSLFCILAFAGFAALLRIKKSFFDNVAIDLAVGMSVLAISFLPMLVFLIGASRFFDYVENTKFSTKFKLLLTSSMSLVFLYLIIFTSAGKEFINEIRFPLTLMGVTIVLIVVLHIATYYIIRNQPRLAERLKNLLKTILAMAEAKKEDYCPPVKPPKMNS